MNEIIDKYVHARNKIAEYNKIMDHCKEKIKNHLKDYPNQNYCNNGYEAKLKTNFRETIHKKDVPNDIWEKYAVATKYETLNINKK
jgi:hypothetical protein